MANHNNNLELLLDLIAEHLIQSDVPSITDIVNESQKYIRNGQLQPGAGEGVLALFQKDVRANREDLIQTIGVSTPDGESVQRNLEEIADTVNFPTTQISSSYLESTNSLSVFLKGGNFPDGGLDITDLIVGNGNPLNVSQFIPLNQKNSVVNVEQAEEYLDTNIFELLPTGDTRQARIIRFFQELNALLPPNLPEFDVDGDGMVDRGIDMNWTGSTDYSKNNSISYAQDNQDGNIDEEDAFIHRLKSTANDTNSSRTIEDIYNTILPYLTDILQDPNELEDLPTYTNQSSGYLQFRNPNQGIIVRNTNKEFIEGLDPNNPTYLNTDGTGGFTITMWVRFLDKVSEGTLFNFGNPLRGDGDDTSFGFKLETYVINGNEQPVKSNWQGQIEGEYLSGFNSSGQTWKEIFQDGSFDGNTFLSDDGREEPSEGFFSTSNTERFVRLVVNDNGMIRGSHIGMPFMKRRKGLPEFGSQDFFTDANIPPYDHAYGLMTNTRIPENFNEWYFICASFNPDVDEDNSFYAATSLQTNPNFWLNHIEVNGEFTNFSNLGNRCKVEIISRTDLLRARGFKG